MDSNGIIYSLLGGCRDTCQRTRSALRDKCDARDKNKLLVRQVDEY